MKIKSIVLALALSAPLFAGCSTHPVERRVHRESQFVSQLEYVRFCQHQEVFFRECY